MVVGIILMVIMVIMVRVVIMVTAVVTDIMIKPIIILVIAIIALSSCSKAPQVCDDFAHEVYQKGEIAVLNVTGEIIRITEIHFDWTHCDITGKHAKEWYHVGLKDGHVLLWLTEDEISKRTTND